MASASAGRPTITEELNRMYLSLNTRNTVATKAAGAETEARTVW